MFFQDQHETSYYAKMQEFYEQISRKLELKQKEFKIIPEKYDFNSYYKNQQPIKTTLSQIQIQSPNQNTQPKQVNQMQQIETQIPNIPNDVFQELQNLLIQPQQHPKFDDLQGVVQTKQAFRNALINPKLRPDLFTGNRRAPQSILCFGPSGTGKTLITRAAANEAQMSVLCVSASSIMDKFVGEAEKRIKYIFHFAASQGCLLFIDEIDSIIGNRSSSESETSRRVKTEFLQLTDGLNNSKCILIGATNRPQDLDDAARRRFQERIYMPLPSVDERRGCIDANLTKDKHRLNAQDVDKIARMTERFSYADLKVLAQNAALQVLRGVDVTTIQGSEVYILAKHYENALREVRASNSEVSLKELQAWQNKQ